MVDYILEDALRYTPSGVFIYYNTLTSTDYEEARASNEVILRCALAPSEDDNRMATRHRVDLAPVTSGKA